MATNGDEGLDDASISSAQFAGASAEEDAVNNLDQVVDNGASNASSPGALSEDYLRNADDHLDESEDGDADRENRFQGLSNVWHDRTADERNLAASLDQQRANDLGVHLYNAHSLKAQIRDPDAGSKAKPHEAKKRWLKSDGKGDTPWHPDAVWTAWPLDPEHVPRRTEQFGSGAQDSYSDGSTYKMQETWKPSADLEDEVQALMLAKAKNNLREREQMHTRHSSNTQLVILADDDEAADVLHTSFLHVLHNFDGLLDGLRKNRKGQMDDRYVPRVRANAQSAMLEAYVASEPHGAMKQSPDRRASKAVSEEVDINEDAPDSALSRLNKSTRVRGQRFAARDWSEVLGVAALVGWSPAIVTRAKVRCASLFGEDMNFAGSRVGERKPSETLIPGFTDVTENSKSNSQTFYSEPMKQWYRCPLETCSRHNEPYEKAWRWREHMKRSHKYDNEQISAIERDTNGLTMMAVAPAGSEADREDSQDIHGAAELGEAPPVSIASRGGEVENKKNNDVRTLEQDPIMYNGVHLDGFLQPIDIKIGRGKDKQPSEKRIAARRVQRSRTEELENEEVNV